MAEPITYSCDIKQGFEFKKTEQTHVGHLLKFKVGADTDLALDLTTILKPLDAAAISGGIVGIISNISWGGGASEPMQLDAQISYDNQDTLYNLLRSGLSNIEIEFDFVVYQYDQKAKVYFPAFKKAGSDNLKGIIRKSGGSLMLNVSNTQSQEVPVPANYSMSVTINPQETQMDLQWASKDTANKVFKWGITKTGKK